MCAGRPPLLARRSTAHITAVNVKDFAIVQPGEVLFQIDDRIYKQRVHQAQATLAMKEAALRNNPATAQKRRGDDRQE